jgi:hypothetical protein
VRGKGLFRKRIKPAGTGVALDGGIELLRVECLKPCAKTRQLARRKLFDGCFDVFGCSHDANVAFSWGVEKSGR